MPADQLARATTDRVWAAFIFPTSQQVLGATRVSDQLHHSREAAKQEAASWTTHFDITWDDVDETFSIGAVQSRLFSAIVRSFKLPDGVWLRSATFKRDLTRAEPSAKRT